MADGSIAEEAARLAQFCAVTADTRVCVDEIVGSIQQRFGVDSAIYLLDRSRCDYGKVSGAEAFPAAYPTAAAAASPALRAMRGDTCVALLKLSSDLAPACGETTAYAAIALAILGFLHNRRFAQTLLSTSHAPIDFHQPNADFFKELEIITALSSGMYAGALRELDAETGELRALFAWNNGLPGDVTLTHWDIDVDEPAGAIRAVIDSRAPQIVIRAEDDDNGFFGRPEQSNIRTAVVCPVLVGAELFGTLSFGLPIIYELSTQEIDGFMVLANATGVAIQNFRRAAIESIEVGDSIRNATVVTAIEVAQAARHSAKTVIDTVNIKIGTLEELAEKVPGQLRHDLLTGLGALSDQVLTITKSLDDIKAATRPPKTELVVASLATIWREATNPMRGRLIKENIATSWEAADAKVLCYPDQLKQVFLNLLINSIDAFMERRSSGRRLVQCRIETIVGDRITLRYNDNAGGLDIAKLRTIASTMDDAALPAALIFQKDVTTKGEEGSGFGLYICRRIMDRHEGSIEVLDYRRGMTFRIILGLGNAK